LAYPVVSFREKPDRKTVEEFLSSGRFLWNSGMFAFTADFILREFRRHAPEALAPFEGLPAPPDPVSLGEGLRVLGDWPGLAGAYAAAPSISFDYAIAEKCGDRAVVRAGFDWTDVGSWDEYARLLGDPGGEVYLSGAENCFVDSDLPAALCAVRDLIVVVRSGGEGGPGAVLIAKKGETQRVREIVEKIRAAGRAGLL
jgi:mannose-1-phosphate guanylyltransferase/mannose-1-phosphate guanylyltransferase/mannose-6-phosphate isomerase